MVQDVGVQAFVNPAFTSVRGSGLPEAQSHACQQLPLGQTAHTYRPNHPPKLTRACKMGMKMAPPPTPAELANEPTWARGSSRHEVGIRGAAVLGHQGDGAVQLLMLRSA